MIYKVKKLNFALGHVQVTVHKDEADIKGKDLVHIPIHSPSGFSYGYSGSGPADLALAILAHHLGERKDRVMGYYYKGFAYGGKPSIALQMHQSFKEKTVALWPQNIDEHQIDTTQINSVLLEISKERQTSDV